jgi:hypothetical protein
MLAAVSSADPLNVSPAAVVVPAPGDVELGPLPASIAALPRKGIACTPGTPNGRAMPVASRLRSRKPSRADGPLPTAVVSSIQSTWPPRTATEATSSFQASVAAALASLSLLPGVGRSVSAIFFEDFFPSSGLGALKSRFSRPSRARCTVSSGWFSSMAESFTARASGRTSARPSLSRSKASRSWSLASTSLTRLSWTVPLSRTAGAGVCSNASFTSASSTADCRCTGSTAGR